MLTDKELKKKFKEVASKDYKKYYPVKLLEGKGFSRAKCETCGTYFWSLEKREVCGNSPCSGGFTFIGKPFTKNKMDYIEVWQNFSTMFEKFGYKPINRYPVVARWNPTMDFTIASIAAFQPYVVSGEVEPPAKKLVIPQFCLRFGDIDNVGLTGHFTLFVMIGQHQFVSKEEWDQEKAFSDLYEWFVKGIGLEKKDIVIHEDAWAGGGNFGPCMEFFSGGLELANQVYMMYEQTANGDKELKLKVLDMGMGHERNAWFTLGTINPYEATFPTVCKKLYEVTGVKPDKDLLKKFMPYAGNLNIDEIDDIDKEWEKISKILKIDKEELKNKILPLQALYSIAEHSRALLVALNDGAIPSNVGGEYNLRVLFRRAYGFIKQYKWNIDLGEVCEWHASYLHPLFPELKENLDSVKKILEVEKEKYEQTRIKSGQIIERLIATGINEDKLIEVYDSNGIPPELIKSEAAKKGMNVAISEDFYKKVSERHEKKTQEHATRGKTFIEDFEKLPATKSLYYDDYKLIEFDGIVLGVKDNFIVLDQSVFYPTSGGQLHDVGYLNDCEVVDVFKQSDKIVHEVKDCKLKVKEKVHGKVDWKWREQLAIHHTATHVINNAARQVLGKHLNQAGAKKTFEKAHIDVTHYKPINEEELKKIEQTANDIVKRNITVEKKFLKRDEAEKKYGMSIYQGGAVPGKELRIVNILGWDVECCGGTHLNSTSEIGGIKLLRASKISDSIVRIEFVAGPKAKEIVNVEGDLLKEAALLLHCDPDEVPGRAEELFKLWKDVVKKGKKTELKLISKSKFEGDALKRTAEILKTQPDYIIKTIKRFKDEIGL